MVVFTNDDSQDGQVTTDSELPAFSLEDALARVCVQGSYVDGDAPILRNAKTAGNCRGKESYIYVGTYDSEFMRDNDITDYIGSYAVAQNQEADSYALIATNSNSPSADIEPLADMGWTITRR